MNLVVTLPTVGVRISLLRWACLYVSLFVCPFARLKKHVPQLHEMACSSDDDAIRYVLPVLWMTSTATGNMYRKFRDVWTRGFSDMSVDRQT